MKSLNVLFAVLILPLFMAAQPSLEGGLFLGMSNYQGDFTQWSYPAPSETNLAIGLVGRHYLDYTKAVRVNLIYGKLSGDDANYGDRVKRGYTFETSLVELSVLGEWEPFGANRNIIEPTFKERLSPYAFAGLGIAYIDPNPDFGPDVEEKIAEDLLADYSNMQVAVPFGIGLKVTVNQMLQAGAEFGMRAPFTDYLDGLSIGGNPNGNDWYMFGGATLMYRLY